jgi:hypothetical protein
VKKLQAIKLSVVILASLCAAAISCAKKKAEPPKTPPPSNLAEFKAATTGKDPEAVAQFVLETYDCNTCHTIDETHKLVLTEQIQRTNPPFPGCRPLLADMNIIDQLPDAERTPEEKKKAQQFKEYGCSFCHEIVPGKMGLTDIGDQLGFFHQGCSEGFCCANGSSNP